MRLIHLHNNGDVTVPTVLRKCADKLAEVGVAKGTRVETRHYKETMNGGMCALGVLGEVILGDPWWVSNSDAKFVERAMEKALGLTTSSDSYYDDYPIVVWNNEPTRPESEIIAGFRKAADIIEVEDTTTTD